MQETQKMQVQSLSPADLLEQEVPTHSNILAWEITQQRSLEGCSPWVQKESDMTEHTQRSSQVARFYNFHMYVSDTAYLHKSLLVFSLWGCVCVCVYVCMYVCVCVCVCVYTCMLYTEIFMHSDLSVFFLLTLNSSHL